MVSGTVFWEHVMLTDVTLRKAKAAQKPCKMAEGQGLHLLEVVPESWTGC